MWAAKDFPTNAMLVKSSAWVAVEREAGSTSWAARLIDGLLGGFVGSFAKVIDFWFNNAEDDVKLLEHADD